MLATQAAVSGITAALAELATAADDSRWLWRHMPEDAPQRANVDRDASRFESMAERAAALLAEMTTNGGDAR